ncbi:hypothetical protein O181_026617 [Austropuccinia psidii MF-1]|uniref:Retrotransposon gag domain-containing protein n=1 Tax=Austropuccinia psidii MF-1 TaxID=1389203 RepID=A0A9Q3CQY3_9BASI|nr:hypothetical protein [Austropuccinia psidii MF-1]
MFSNTQEPLTHSEGSDDHVNYSFRIGALEQVISLTNQLQETKATESCIQGTIVELFSRFNSSHSHISSNTSNRPSSPPVEPPILHHMFFSGLPNELPPFLYLIDDHMPSIHHKFNTEQHRIYWIALHFRPRDKQTVATFSAYNWWISVLRENAMIQGLPSNSSLASNVYVLPHLLTIKLFCEKLQEIFGDKFEGENAKRALQSCKQDNRLIGEYNSHFSSLVYEVDLTEQTCCDIYKAGLNVKILDVALR